MNHRLLAPGNRPTNNRTLARHILRPHPTNRTRKDDWKQNEKYPDAGIVVFFGKSLVERVGKRLGGDERRAGQPERLVRVRERTAGPGRTLGRARLRLGYLALGESLHWKLGVLRCEGCTVERLLVEAELTG